MTPTASTRAWTLLQALELLRRIEAHVSADFTFHEEGGEPIVTSAAAIGGLKQTAAELVDEVTQLEHLVERLPDAEVSVTASDVQAGASRQLAEGIMDVRTALLAASALPIATGWPALANALRDSDAHLCWDETTLVDLLGRFRGARPEAIDRVLEQAQVDASAQWAEISPQAVARLAEALATAADARPQ